MQSLNDSAKERDSNLELLRIICIVGVIVLHYNFNSFGGAYDFVQESQGKLYLLYLFELVCAVAVNIFIMLSGFFLCNTDSRSFWKPLQLIIEVIVINVGLSLIHMFRAGEFSGRQLLSALLPVNYFVILYCTLYIISPLINAFLQKYDFRRALIILLLLFSVYPIIVEILKEISESELAGLSTISISGSGSGYTIIHFILMYTIGAAIRIAETLETNKHIHSKNEKLLSVYLINLCILFFWVLFDSKYSTPGATAWQYCNPLLIGNSVIIFLAFTRMKERNSKVINELARCIFTVYLIHPIVLRFVRIEYFSKQNVIIWVLHIMITCATTIAVGYFVYKFYALITNPIYRKLKEKFGSLQIQY